jgi:hypothetical protein
MRSRIGCDPGGMLGGLLIGLFGRLGLSGVGWVVPWYHRVLGCVWAIDECGCLSAMIRKMLFAHLGSTSSLLADVYWAKS